MKNNIDLFVENPQFFEERKTFYNVMKDLFPDETYFVNVVLICFDSGIVTRIKCASEIDDTFYKRNLMILENDYGLTNSAANDALKFWIDTYAVGIYHLKNTVNYELFNNNFEISLAEKNDVLIDYNNSDLTDVSDYEWGEKLPKALIKRNKVREAELGIKAIKTTNIVGQFSRQNICHFIMNLC